ncbi:MAG TPA: trypsin-like peptidase domain-containing protein [Opitutaceae bacterium]|nr:trypsin-like peptidase domain-containing protein [Opitutaceae bacterium]
MLYGGDKGVLKDEQSFRLWITRSAEDGFDKAQLLLGTCYLQGDYGLPKDGSAGLTWIQKAADQNLGAAQLMVGLSYANGNGVKMDKAEGFRWVLKAAQQGVAMAEMQLAQMYAGGEGVQPNEAEAMRWLQKAADSGSSSAQFMLGKTLSEATDAHRDPITGFRYLLMAARQGNEMAISEVGYAYALGKGVPQNESEAIAWLRKRPSPSAEFSRLGSIYAKGNEAMGVTKSATEAIKWFKLSAESGNSDALTSISDIYREGNGVPKDVKEGFKWDLLAARSGDASAQYRVGKSYENGEGAAKDEMEALAWYNIGAASDSLSAIAQQVLEQRLGRQAALIAQARSKVLVSEMVAWKEGTPSGNAADNSGVSSNEPKASGSGAIVSTGGYILTAAHVVAGANGLKVYTVHGIHTATIVRIDEANDIAVLKLDGGPYPALPIAPSRSIRLGQPVATIGFPNIEIQGFSPKVTKGEISSLNGVADDPRAWQISVPVQPGNSGGALLDENGNLIGIVVSKLGMKAAQATGDIPQNVNYAVKSTYALALIEPYLAGDAPAVNQPKAGQRFEDMVAKAQQSVVLILVY